ncbi:glycosyltransferase family 2 protein [Vibrio sp. 10N.286.51.B11]|uniref:glycosyltransferase family 2 protein n=1 Tax=Vibrio sp. 10N.286.51.B11 TaxID=3229706 RepID=UPI00354FDB32
MINIKEVILRSEKDIISSWLDKEEIIVSVICVTFNHEAYIEDAIRSFLMQETDFSFEIIVHDDASTDTTADIIRSYQKLYPNIVKPIFQSKNQYSKGTFRVVPYAESFSSGKYIARCEGDDFWCDELKLKKQVEFLDKHSDYVITYADSIKIGKDGALSGQVGNGVNKDLSKIELMKTQPINTLTACYRNVHLKFPNEFSITPIGDLFYWSLLGTYGKGKYLDSIKPSAYRVHDGGVFSSVNSNEKSYMVIKSIALLYLYYKRIGDQQISDYFLKELFKRLITKNNALVLFRSLIDKTSFFLKNKLIRK